MSELISAFAGIDPTKSQREAFPFVLSAVTRGLKQVESEIQYRAGGGVIGHVQWAEIYQAAFQVAGWREETRDIPLHWTIPEHMFTQSKEYVDWSTGYVFKAKVEVYNTATKSWEERWVHSGFDELPTHAEWRADALKRLEMDPELYPYDFSKGVRWINEDLWKRRAR